nr:response regulator [Thermoanaerobaculia bacterium]
MLIVEDEQVLLWSLERALEALPGVETICCGSVEAALAHLVELRPGVIVLDIHLPGLSGIDLLEDLAVQGAGVPVIVTTAYRAQHEQALRRFPNVEVLEKPVPLELLRERIQARLARRDRVDREEEEKDAVFEVADYLQLAAMTRASVAVEVTLADGRRGRIEVWHGEAWTAECGELAARDALGELIFAARTGMRMRQLARPTGERRFHHRLEL